MSQQYMERLLGMVAELEAHPHIFVEEFEVYPPATSEELEAANEYHTLEPAMREFYSACNGFTLMWWYEDGPLTELGLPIEGCIRMWGIEETFRPQIGSMYFGDGVDLHPIDYFTPEACAAIAFAPVGPSRVYLHNEGKEPMHVGFGEYLDLMLEARGFAYWQVAIAEREYGDRMPMDLEELGFRLIMPELFANFDAGRFPSRVKQATTCEEVATTIDVIGGDSSRLPEYRYFRSLEGGGAPAQNSTSAPQSKIAMLLVCWFVGWLGIHRMLMGHKNWWLVPLTCGVCGLWPLIDLVLILTGHLRMADGQQLS